MLGSGSVFAPLEKSKRNEQRLTSMSSSALPIWVATYSSCYFVWKMGYSWSTKAMRRLNRVWNSFVRRAIRVSCVMEMILGYCCEESNCLRFKTFLQMFVLKSHQYPIHMPLLCTFYQQSDETLWHAWRQDKWRTIWLLLLVSTGRKSRSVNLVSKFSC